MDSNLKRSVLKGVLAALGFIGAIAFASTFNLFAPASGILVGNPNTYITTAATFSDVAGLWTGTNCGTTTNVPQLNGNCVAPGGSGTVTSVGLSDGSSFPIFTITNTPVTSSGTLTETLVTQPANLVFAGPTSGGSAQPFFRNLVAADIPALGANPTATIGLTAVNGSATTYTRSDGAPALSQAISPTWSGTHTFSNAITVNGAGSSLKGGVTVTAPASGVALTSTGVANSAAAVFNGASTSGQSIGLNIFAGTTSADHPLVIANQANTVIFEEIFGDGHGTLGPTSTLGLSWNTAGDVVVATPSSGIAFTANGTTSGVNNPILTQSSDSAYQLTLGYNYGTANVINSSGSSARALQIEIGNTVYATWATSGGLTLATPSSGSNLTINGNASGSNGLVVNGSATTGQSFGIAILAGTNSSDHGFQVLNQTGVTNYFNIAGDGGITLIAPTGGDKGAGTINAQGDIFINNVSVRIASLSATCTSGGCTAVTANGISTTITRGGTGSYTVTFSPTFGSAPVCVVGSLLGSTASYGTTITAGPSSTGVTVATFSGTTAADEDFSLICNGT
jgi:hypothetical protein